MKSYVALISELTSYGISFSLMESVIRRTRLTYAGHIERLDNNRLTKIVMHSEISSGKRCSGGQGVSWRSCLAGDLKCFNIDCDSWQILCRNRIGWRRAIDAGEKFFVNKWMEQQSEASRKRYELKLGSENTTSRIVVSKPQQAIIDACHFNFNAIENACNMSGVIVTGRGSGGVGASVCCFRRKHRPGVLMDAPSRTFRKLDEAKGRPAGVTEKLWCVCQQPNDEAKSMIQCNKCDCWYHFECVNVTAKDIAKDVYYCGFCSKNQSWPKLQDIVLG